MIEKLGAIVSMVFSILALMGLSTLDLPTFITALLALVCSLIFLVGNVFLFSEGTILTSTQKARTAFRVGKTIETTET